MVDEEKPWLAEPEWKPGMPIEDLMIDDRETEDPEYIWKIMKEATCFSVSGETQFFLEFIFQRCQEYKRLF